MRKTLNTVLVVSAMAAMAAPFSISSAAAEPTIEVAYHRSDLSDPVKMMQVYDRIADAATSVCREANRFADFPAAAARSCRAEALSVAIADVGAPALSAYHERLHEGAAHASEAVADASH